MNSLTGFCWLGSFVFCVASLYGQYSKEVLHDLIVHVENLEPHGSGMGGGEATYDPSRPDRAGNLVVQVVNNSKRDLVISPEHVRICAALWDLKLNGVPFLYEGDVTVPAGKTLDIMKVPLQDILDPTRLKSQRTIHWEWSRHPSPPTSPIMLNGKDYENFGLFWVEHMRDRHVLRSRPFMISVSIPQTR